MFNINISIQDWHVLVGSLGVVATILLRIAALRAEGRREARKELKDFLEAYSRKNPTTNIEYLKRLYSCAHIPSHVDETISYMVLPEGEDRNHVLRLMWVIRNWTWFERKYYVFRERALMRKAIKKIKTKQTSYNQSGEA